MPTGAFTPYLDVATLVLYAFWIFFAGLILYIRREDKREGYPLESERSQYIRVQGFPAIPSPKTFLHRDGSTHQSPRDEGPQPDVDAVPVGPWPGAPLVPEGSGLGKCIGPGSYAQRADVPDKTWDGAPRIVPMRTVGEAMVDRRDADPRGMPLVGADGDAAGEIVDLWIDMSEPHVRYLEAELGGDAKRILVPMNFAVVDKRRQHVKVEALKADHFAGVPGLANPDTVTLLEEDKVCGYFGGGTLYADPSREEPWI